MSARYAPLPNPRTDPSNSELDAAFDGPDDEDEEVDESHPLNPIPSPEHPLASQSHHLGPQDRHSQEQSTLTYDFDSPIADYDHPPPGSPPPPPPPPHALPNSMGNTHGVMPVFTPNNVPRPSTSWWRRTASAVLPSHYVSWLGAGGGEVRGRVMGGGAANDGVFKNMSAKPSTARTRVQDGDSIYVVPEETSSTPPPSYATAQADAAPPYHTSTLLLPSDSPLTQGSVIVDALPTGTLFAFLWNTLVSTTFQFIGFVLTWVMSTTHAARYGSRAGLGITLIQWGLGLRARLDDSTTWGDPTFATAKEADEYYQSIGLFNASSPALPPTVAQSQPGTSADPQTGESTWAGDAVLTGPVATDWLSFFLMVCGWYLLLMSSLGFWRVKRWEKSILGPSTASDSRPSPSQGHANALSDSEVDGANPETSFLAPLLYLPRRQDDHNDSRESEGQDQDGDPERSRRWRTVLARNRTILEELRSVGYL